MRTPTWILVLALIFLAATAVCACPPVVSSYTPYVAPSYTPAVVAVPIYIPVYGAGFVAPPAVVAAANAPTVVTGATPGQAVAGTAAKAEGSDTKQILDLLKSMDTRISNLEKRQGAAPDLPAPATAPPPLSAQTNPPTVLTVCASCHSRGSLKKDTKGKEPPALFDEQGVSIMTDALIRRSVRQVKLGAMPPSDSAQAKLVTPEAANALLDLLDDLQGVEDKKGTP